MNSPVLSIGPVVLSVADRPVDLQLRVTAPVGEADPLPVILLSHGQGYSNHLSSLNGYAPLAQYWAAQGFAVLQPTHLSSRSLALPPETPGAPLFWRSRAEDMSVLIDRFDEIEAAAPVRLDRDRIAVAGHSMGGHTASLLLGMRVEGVDLADRRIKAGVLLASTGRGDAVTEFVLEHYSFMSSVDFSAMATPALVVAGDKDTSTHLTTSGPRWHEDPYHLAPGPKSLLTLVDAEHGLGGVSGYDVAETTDENPERVAVVQRLTTAYLRSRLNPGDTSWDAVELDPRLGRIESKMP